MGGYRHRPLNIFIVTIMSLVVACGRGMNKIDVKMASGSGASNCDLSGKCVKDPVGLIAYNSELVSDGRVVKQASETGLTSNLVSSFMSLVRVPELLLISEKIKPLVRGIALVAELDPCDSANQISGNNPTASQLRELKDGRYKACIAYMGEGLQKRVLALDPINVDLTKPQVAGTIRVSEITSGGANISWSKAIDNLTPDGDLIYRVFVSSSRPLSSLDDIKKYGHQADCQIKGLTTYAMTSLVPRTDYHAAVVVNDEAGNEALVGSANFSTSSSVVSRPAVTITSNRDPGPTNLTSISLTIEFSASVTGFDASDITVTGATKGTFAAVDQKIYTQQLTATGSNVSASIAALAAQDAGGNQSLASNNWSLTVNGAVAAPTFSVAAGTYLSTQSVVLSSSTPGATIYYTLDGSTPTSASSVYSEAITVSTTKTIMAIAVKPAYNNSAVAAANYIFLGTPTDVIGYSGNSKVILTWFAPSSGGGSIINYSIKYSSNSGSTWSSPLLTGSTNTSYDVTGLANSTSYIFQVAAVIAAGVGGYSASSDIVTPISTVACSGDCYADTNATSTLYAEGPGGVSMEYVDSGAGTHFKIWREFGGARILNASGLVANGWQQTLTRPGTGFSISFTDAAKIAGRVCPTNVFISFSNMMATGLCLYYDVGTSSIALADESAGTEAQDWLQAWNRAGTGQGAGSSYFEGNIKTCADKGMRLPTMYETAMTKPTTGLPTGDGLNSEPAWAGSSNGVPGSNAWTASARGGGDFTSYWIWNGSSGSQARFYFNFFSARCVAPSRVASAPNQPVEITGSEGDTQVTLSWTAPLDYGGTMIMNYSVRYSADNGSTWSTPVLTGTHNPTYTATSLTNGTPYIFQVAAVNSIGQGTYSVSSSPFIPSTLPGQPMNLRGTIGIGQVALTWSAPANANKSPTTGYYYRYSVDNGGTWSTPVHTGSSNSSYTVTGLTNGTSYIFQVAAINALGTGNYSTSSNSVTPVNPAPCNGDCYTDADATNAILAVGPGGLTIVYEDSGAGTNFKIWKELGGTRILNATGYTSNGWQQTLTRAGTGFSGSNFSTGSNIAGRVCPTNVFLGFSDMKAQGRCLYYDAGSAAQTLDAAGTNLTEAQDWLKAWNGDLTGRGTNSSFFEGNIKTCADKGMRLPTMYETAMSKPDSYIPTGDGLSAEPTWSDTTNGVPSVGTGRTWTASAFASNSSPPNCVYFTWSGAGASGEFTSCGYATGTGAVRCVLP